MKTLLLILAVPLQASACIWVDGTTLDGSHHKFEGKLPDRSLKLVALDTPEDRLEELVRQRRELKSDEASEREFAGVCDLLSGNTEKAITMLEQLEISHPGRYSTAVNLGTAYELKGDLEGALKWISEGVRRNPQSHFGTEWLHVEILKARIRLKTNPDFFRHHNVVELPQNFSSATSVRIGDDARTADEIRGALFYQLQERMVFVKAPDQVVADLLFTFGRIEARTSIVESGIKLLEMSYNYGFARPELLKAEINQYEKVIRDAESAKNRRTNLYITAFTAGTILFPAFLVMAWRKKWFFLTAKAYQAHRREMAARVD